LKDTFTVQLKDGTQFLITTHKSDKTINVYIGGPHAYCIQGQINRKTKIKSDNNRMDDLFPPHVAHIHNVYNDNICAANRRFKRGSDTRNIFHLMLTLIKRFAPYVSEIRFTDKSTRECDNGIHVNLAVMHYLQDGRTWYETHFNAKMNPRDKDELQKAEETLESHKISWEILNDHFITTNQLPLSESEMEELYNSAKSTLAFFRALYKEIGIAQFCVFISPWIHLLMDKPYFPFSFHTAKFSINASEIVEMPFEFVVNGGGKQTRKRRRRHLGAGF
jgi:hypothetical protein